MGSELAEQKEVLQQAHEWMRLDQDPVTRSEIEALISADDVAGLTRRFIPRISFGTAGLRARVEGGFARMNSLVVIQASQGLAQHLLETVKGAITRGIVIGFDGRRDSRHFAQMVAAAFVAKGFRIIWYADPVHTPLVPFGVREYGAAGGVMITASHNPKEDNGYKVYAANGCQINDPEDKMIAKAILANLEPLSWEVPKLEDYREKTASKYFDCVATLGDLDTHVRFVYTPMHGVGLRYLRGAIFRITGKESSFETVPEQAMPDPEFPTVKFPNPEETGALDLAKQHADRLGIDLIISNDPDADRLAVAEKIASDWYQLKGDEVGVLLGYYVFQQHKSEIAAGRQIVMLNSAVSSQMLGAIGKAEGFVVEETLTGFKWLGNRALQIGRDARFAYEEALGYLVPSVGYDKDGVAAAALLLQACKSWKASPYSVLQGLYEQYGYFETKNTYWVSETTALTKATFDHIVAAPKRVASAMGDSIQCRVRNLIDGTDTTAVDGKSDLPSSPESLMVTLWLSGAEKLCEGVRCTLRASGTEPKLKVYIECQSKTSREAAATGALLVLQAVRKTWFQDARLHMEAKYEAESRG